MKPKCILSYLMFFHVWDASSQLFVHHRAQIPVLKPKGSAVPKGSANLVPAEELMFQTSCEQFKYEFGDVWGISCPTLIKHGNHVVAEP